MEMPTNPRFMDLTGHTYGRWTVISYDGKKGVTQQWDCRCECGIKRVVSGCSLKGGGSKSCGCLMIDKLIKRTDHGMSNSVEYRCYAGMKARCNNKQDIRYKNYGGRGIAVCDRWVSSFDRFFEDMGYRPTPQHSIDRIDNNKGYYPDNCRWATRSQQGTNRRVPKNNTSGVKGVGRTKLDPKWYARISINGKNTHLGYFTDKAKAIEVRKQAELEHYS